MQPLQNVLLHGRQRLHQASLHLVAHALHQQMQVPECSQHPFGGWARGLHLSARVSDGAGCRGWDAGLYGLLQYATTPPEFGLPHARSRL